MTRLSLIPLVYLSCCVESFQNRLSTRYEHPETKVMEMKRPILDQIASTLFSLENERVKISSVTDENGREGEPMEWSESESWANRFSQIIASNSLGAQFKQWVADIVAGEYDREAVAAEITSKIEKSDVLMFSFTTCPFCRRAKDYLDRLEVEYSVVELDELPEGNAYRASLGRITGRTSVPSIFIGGNYIGGCNDGSPGLMPLANSGKLEPMLDSVGVSYSSAKAPGAS